LSLLKSYKVLLNEFRETEKRVNGKLLYNEELIKSFLSSCESGYDLGVSKHHRNWCVFAAQGKQNDYVKFIDLSHLDMLEIVRLSESLTKEKKQKIDAPLGIKDRFQFSR